MRKNNGGVLSMGWAVWGKTQFINALKGDAELQIT